jgi:hypothetical protein
LAGRRGIQGKGQEQRKKHEAAGKHDSPPGQFVHRAFVASSVVYPYVGFLAAQDW